MRDDNTGTILAWLWLGALVIAGFLLAGGDACEDGRYGQRVCHYEASN